MVSRTTDDYKRMAAGGCVMVSEPAFWAGFDRSGPEASATTSPAHRIERHRRGPTASEHYCWLCINAKEAENVALVPRGHPD